MLSDDPGLLTDLTSAQVGDAISVPPGNSVLPGLYVVTKAERKDRDDHLIEVDLTLQDVRFAGQGWAFTAVID